MSNLKCCNCGKSAHMDFLVTMGYATPEEALCQDCVSNLVDRLLKEMAKANVIEEEQKRKVEVVEREKWYKRWMKW